MLEGTWTLIGGEQDSQPIPDAELASSKLEITDNRHNVVFGGATHKGTHQIDDSQRPMRIDTTDTEGPFQGQTLLGIFKLSGDELTICFAAPGAPRPTDFTTQGGQATLLHTWKRA